MRFLVLPGDYSGHIFFFFENGKAARVALSAYQTASNRRRLTGAYSDRSPVVQFMVLTEDREIALYSTEPRALIVNTALMVPKSTRTTQGVNVLTMKPKYRLDHVCLVEESGSEPGRYRGRNIPAAGALVKEEDSGEEQLTLI